MSDFQHAILDNGLQVIGEHLPGVQSAGVAFFVRHGAIDDSPEVSGLAHLTESTLFRGTASRSSRQLTEELDAIGARHSSSTGLEMTLLNLLALGKHLPRALEILDDVVRNPSFPEAELEAVRALQLQEIGQRIDQPAQLVMDLARQRYFGSHPFGHDALGSPETVERIDRGQVLGSWQLWFRPAATLVAMAGSFDWTSSLDQLRRLTADWDGEMDAQALAAPDVNPEKSVVKSTAAQENLCFIFPGVGFGDRHYYAASLAATILGSGMNSRLFMEVREKRGLAYSVGARFDAMSSTGIVRVYVGTQPERGAESVEVIQRELARLERDGVTDEELQLGKTRLKSRLIMGSESTWSRVMSIGRDWFFERRYRPLSEIRESIDSVSREDVLQYLRDSMLTEQLGLAALGPLSPSELGIPSPVDCIPMATVQS